MVSDTLGDPGEAVLDHVTERDDDEAYAALALLTLLTLGYVVMGAVKARKK